MAAELGRRLRGVRELRGWSLARTAEEANVSTAYIQKLERGEVASPSPHKLRTLAQALEIPYEEAMRLAGYWFPEPDASSGDAAVRMLAEALQAENLTAAELEDLGEYLRFRRSQQRGHRRPFGPGR
jgi:transcriptional regulator with XRE-family HTH domain